MKVISLLLILLSLTSTHALAGVTHPCSERQFDVTTYEAIRVVSLDRQLIANLELRQFANKTCVNYGPGHRHVEIKASITKANDGQPLSNFTTMHVQTLDKRGRRLEEVRSSIPLASQVRLVKGATAVAIFIDGFDGFAVAL